MKFLFATLTLVACYMSTIDAHGSLYDPPARSSAWRFDKDNRFPPYYNDMEMFCGGISTQWDKHGGKCGICGDPWDENPRKFEKGGHLYRGIVVRNYNKGDTIDVHVDLPSNHQGWFEFRICDVDGWEGDATQECLDKTVLKDPQGVSRFTVPGWDHFVFKHKLVLPEKIKCNHCVFQWKYHAGNNWGTDPVTGLQCIGCAPRQEEFYGCADVQVN